MERYAGIPVIALNKEGWKKKLEDAGIALPSPNEHGRVTIQMMKEAYKAGQQRVKKPAGKPGLPTLPDMAVADFRPLMELLQKMPKLRGKRHSYAPGVMVYGGYEIRKSLGWSGGYEVEKFVTRPDGSRQRVLGQHFYMKRDAIAAASILEYFTDVDWVASTQGDLTALNDAVFVEDLLKSLHNRWVPRNWQGRLVLKDGKLQIGDPPPPEKRVDWDGNEVWEIPGTRIKHNPNGPAVVRKDGTKEYWIDGKLHRVGGPAVEPPADKSNGHHEERWAVNGVEHNPNGPAVRMWNDGVLLQERWVSHGQPHREGGPAVTHWWRPVHGGSGGQPPVMREEYWHDGKIGGPPGVVVPTLTIYDEKGNLARQEWMKDGKLHNLKGPAVIEVSGGARTEEWYKDGKLHRDRGPAVILADGLQVWYKDGKPTGRTKTPNYGVRFARAKVLQKRDLGGGINKTEIVELDKPLAGKTKAVFKPRVGEDEVNHARPKIGSPNVPQFVREVAASKVAKLLGMTAPVARAVNLGEDGIGVVIEWIDGRLPKDSRGGHGYNDPNIKPESLAKMAIFDWIIGNTDRHGANAIVTADGEVVPIDHGLTFPDNPNYELYNKGAMRAAQKAGLKTSLKKYRKLAEPENRPKWEKALEGLSDAQKAAVYKRLEVLAKFDTLDQLLYEVIDARGI